MFLTKYFDEVSDSRTNRVKVRGGFAGLDGDVDIDVTLNNRGIMYLNVYKAGHYESVAFESWAYQYAPKESEKMLIDGEYLVLMAAKAVHATEKRNTVDVGRAS